MHDFAFSTISARLIDAIRINKTVEVQQGDKSFLLKQRYTGRGWVIRCGNVFLRLSNSKIIMFPNARVWQDWEIHSFTLLYHAACSPVNHNAILCEKLPGTSLRRLLAHGLLNANMMQAAGREFARAHALYSSTIGGLWSHGDPHLDNVLYDAESDGVFLIDFETRHWPTLADVHRHADDLLVFLLDLLGRDKTEHWKRLCQTFLACYDRKESVRALAGRLKMPHGLELILWKTRTDNCSTQQLRIRLRELCEVVGAFGE